MYSKFRQPRRVAAAAAVPATAVAVATTATTPSVGNDGETLLDDHTEYSV